MRDFDDYDDRSPCWNECGGHVNDDSPRVTITAPVPDPGLHTVCEDCVGEIVEMGWGVES